MTSTPTHRGLAAALLVTVLVSLYFMIVQPVLDAHHAIDSQIEQEELRLSKLLAMVNSREALSQKLSMLKAKEQRSNLFVRGKTPSLAGATLQNHFKSIIEAADAQLLSIRMLPASEEKTLARVSASARLRATVEVLQEVLYATETQTPLLFIDKLSIRSRARYARSGTPANPTLDIDIEFSGYARTAKDVS